MDINYELYKTFYYAAQYKNLTQAANVLMSSQPNVTRAIRNLEQALGCRLFFRSNRGVRLTPEGELLYGHVAAAVEHIQAGENAIAASQSLQAGSVSVAASDIAMHCCLMAALREFRGAYPGVKIHVSRQSTPQAMRLLKGGLMDFAVVTGPLEPEGSLEVRRLLEIREAAVCSAAFPELDGRVVKLAELTHYPIIGLGAETTSFEFFSAIFSERGLRFRPDIEAASSDQALSMVKSDLGVGFVPVELLEEGAENLTIIRLEQPLPRRPICLVKRRGQRLSRAAQALEKTVIAQAGAEM